MKGTLPIQLNYKVYNEYIIPADIHANWNCFKNWQMHGSMEMGMFGITKSQKEDINQRKDQKRYEVILK